MRSVDTNVLVRLMTRDDAAQAAAAERWVEPGAWVPLLAVAEATWVLSAVYDREPKAVATAVEMLLDHRHLVLQDADVVADALTTFRRRPALGFSDCLMVASAQKAGHVPLGTFDKGVARLDDAERVQ